MSIRTDVRELLPFLEESWAMGWPMILIMFFQFAIGLTDVLVAKYLGTDVQAAVGYVSQLYWTLTILANALSVGTVSMVSQAYGAGSAEGVRRVLSHSLLVGLVISGFMTIVAGLFPETVVRLAGMPEKIVELGVIFIRIFCLVLVPTYVMVITAGVLRASGRVRIAMVNAAITAVVNVACSVGLSFGVGPVPALGFRGIAFATAIAVSLGMVLNLAQMLRGSTGLGIGLFRAPALVCIRNLLRLGTATALQQGSWNIGTLVIYYMVGHLQGYGIVPLTAMTAGVRVEAIVYLPVFAMNMAAAVLTGNRLGAGSVQDARFAAKACAALSLLIVLGPALILFVCAHPVSGLLSDDPAVRAEMARYLRINMLSMPFLAIGITLSGSLQGAGDTVATMRIVMVSMWGLRIPAILAAIHVLSAGPRGIWWAMTFSIVCLTAMMAHRFRSGVWTTASLSKGEKTMLWESCLGRPKN
ncbi:MAG: MATE family efflux transporter [Thermodesulfobacteriota bacterium]